MANVLALMLVALTIGVTLTEAAVQIKPEPNREVGMMNSESRFYHCSSSQKNERVQWVGPNGQEIVNDPAARIYTVNKKNLLKLELKNPNKEDSGVYKCVGKNSVSWHKLSHRVF